MYVAGCNTMSEEMLLKKYCKNLENILTDGDSVNINNWNRIRGGSGNICAFGNENNKLLSNVY